MEPIKCLALPIYHADQYNNEGCSKLAAEMRRWQNPSNLNFHTRNWSLAVLGMQDTRLQMTNRHMSRAAG